MARRIYRRDRLTWAMFAGLFAFGVVNAVLGPALPYLRAEEHLSYFVGALHQLAFALGGGLAGLLALRPARPLGRGALIRLGLLGEALAAIGVGYGGEVAITVAAAFLMSLLGTSALIRMWGVLADAHGPQRTVAMAEGEVAVSLAGIVVPLLLGTLAATALGWRFGFVIAGALVVGTVAVIRFVRIPRARGTSREEACGPDSGHRDVSAAATLTIVFAIVGLEFSLSFWLASYLYDSVGIGRGTAVVMVSGLYAANVVGRLLASRLAHHATAEHLLAGSLVLALVGLPVLLAAHDTVVATLGVALCGIAIGAMFPLTSSLHVGVSSGDADSALGQVLLTASAGQILGPLSAGAIAQTAGLRVGLLVLPTLVAIAGAALFAHARQTSRWRRRVRAY